MLCHILRTVTNWCSKRVHAWHHLHLIFHCHTRHPHYIWHLHYHLLLLSHSRITTANLIFSSALKSKASTSRHQNLSSKLILITKLLFCQYKFWIPVIIRITHSLLIMSTIILIILLVFISIRYSMSKFTRSLVFLFIRQMT